MGGNPEAIPVFRTIPIIFYARLGSGIREGMSLYRFKELREKLGLPRVGERLRSRQHGTVWKVIEKKEIWLPAKPSLNGSEGAERLPAIYLRYWREETSKGPGRGKTMSFEYSINDRSFDKHLEILYDW